MCPADAQEARSGPRRVRSNLQTIPPPAWQSGQKALAAKWQQLSGKYIYHRACSSCHSWGPAYWPRKRWEDYFNNFPDNHQPDVRKHYADLTAMMDVGKAMPTRRQQRGALAAFVVARAPATELSKEQREEKFRALPDVGEPAPDFTISDIQGRKFSLARFRGRQSLVLVFSRAHW